MHQYQTIFYGTGQVFALVRTDIISEAITQKHIIELLTQKSNNIVIGRNTYTCTGAVVSVHVLRVLV